MDDKAAELSVEEMFLVKIKLQETAQQFKVSFGFEALHVFGGIPKYLSDYVCDKMCC